MVIGVSAQVILPTMDALTNRTPIRGETVSVLSGFGTNAWPGPRMFRHYTNTTGFTANSVHFLTAKGSGTGHWRSADYTNSFQDLRWWNGKADGSTDNAAAILAAGEWGGRFGGGVLIPGASANWRVSTPIVSTNSWDLILEKGAVIDGTTLSTNSAITWTGGLEASINLASDAEAGDYLIDLNDASSIVVGDVLQLTATNLWNPYRSAYTAGEFVTVKSISGNEVSLTAPLRDNYTTANLAKVNRIVPVRVRVHGGGRIACSTDGVGISIIRSRDSRIDDIELTGTGKAHGYVYDSIGFTTDRLLIESELGEGTGFGYGIAFVGVQGGVLSRSRISTSRHGFTAGGGSVVNRDIRVIENVFKTYGTSAASVDFHGNCENYVVAFNALDAGVSLGGNKGQVIFNPSVGNPKDQPAIAITEPSGTEFTISANSLSVTDDDSTATVFAMRFRIERASVSYGVSTNNWLGTVTTTPQGRLRITDNAFTLTSRSGDPVSMVLIDSESNLPSNITLGGLEFSGNQFSVGTTNGLPANPWALNVDHANAQIRWQNIRVARNEFGPLPVSVSANANAHTFDGNTWAAVVPASGALLIRGGAGFIASSVNVVGNQFRGVPTFGTYLLDVTGRAVFERNHFEDWAQSAGWGAISATASATAATNLASIALSHNTYQSIGSAPGAVQLSTTTPTITAMDERLPAGFALHAGTSPTSALTWSTTNAMLKATGAPLVVQAYAAASLPSADDGALAFDTTSSNLVVRVSGAWLAVSGNTNAPVTGGSTFDNIVVTNRTFSGYVVASNLSLNQTGTNQNAVTATYPIYASTSTNALARFLLRNDGSGSSVGAALQLQTADAVGRLTVWGTNNSTGNFQSRLVTEAVTGSGISYDLALPSSMEMSWTHSGGTEFASMSTNLFRLYTPVLQADAGASIKAATNVLTYVSGFAADPTSSAVTFVSTTLANLANSLGLSAYQPLDLDLTAIAAYTGASNLVTGVDFTGHYHATDRDRANHTGTQSITTISDSTDLGRSVVTGTADAANQVFNTTSATTGDWTYVPITLGARLVHSSPSLDWSVTGTSSGNSNWAARAFSAGTFRVGPANDAFGSLSDGISMTRSGATALSDIYLQSTATEVTGSLRVPNSSFLNNVTVTNSLDVGGALSVATQAYLAGAVVTNHVTVLDVAYGPSWDGNNEVPTKNAIYDKVGGLQLSGTFSALVVTNSADFFGSAKFNVQMYANGITVTNNVSVADDPYSAFWDGDFAVPTKNAIYDKIESLSPGGGTPLTIFDEFGNVRTNVTSFKVESADIIKTVNYQVSGSGTNIVINSTEAVAPLLIANNSTADGQRFHINSTTPAALNLHDNVQWQVSGTNASAYSLPQNPFFATSDGLVLYEDWTAEVATGQLGWVINSTGGTSGINNGETNVIGNQFLRGSSGSASSSCFAHLGRNAFLFGGMTVTNEWRMKIPALSALNTNKYEVFFGFADNRNAARSAQVDAVGFAYDTNASPNWLVFTSDNTTQTTVDSGVTVDTAWNKFRFVINSDATEVNFYINGTGVGTITNNIPRFSGGARTTGLMAGVLRTNAVGSIHGEIHMDYMVLRAKLDVPR